MAQPIVRSKRAGRIGIALALGCAAVTCPLNAHAAEGDRRGVPTQSAPGDRNAGNPPVDYEHAQPMPLPSASGPPSGRPWPDSRPVPGQSGPPGSAQGDPGSGELTPSVVAPPRPMPETDKAGGADSSGTQPKQ